jgi:hypothetical protein
MSLIDVYADLSGLTSEIRECRAALVRMAEALERVSPPIPEAPEPNSPQSPEPYEHHLSESGSEYQERVAGEASLATSLGVAPWNPDFQRVVAGIRDELTRPRRIQDEEGKWVDSPALTAAEADDAIRKGFIEARAAQNVRP